MDRVPSDVRFPGIISLPAHDSSSLLVRFRPETPAGLRAEARERVGGRLLRAFTIVPGLEHIGLSGPEVDRAIEILMRLPHVLYAEPDFLVYEAAIPNDPYFGDQWGLNSSSDIDIDAPEAWDLTTGDPNLVVAVIDSGIQPDHPDLAANLWINPGEIAGNGADDDGNGYVDDLHGWDWYYEDNDPSDGSGHGTHVAGTVGAAGNNGVGVSGVVWQGKLMALKFLSDRGSGYTSDAIRALEYAVDKAVRVSNNSWGGGSYSQALSDAIGAAGSAGHLFVAAAGNDGRNNDATPSYPSSYGHDNIIAVAAVDQSGALTSWSNYGASSVDIGAPGSSILSTTIRSGYAYKSGTSMAAPHVTGVAALLYGLHPDWSYGQVRNQILSAARPLASLQGKTASGGMVNAGTALSAPVHDVAVTALAAPGAAYQGDPVSVYVTVENQGTYAETTAVSLTDETDGKEIGYQPISLDAGASTTLAFNWDTAASSLGTHTLRAQAGAVSEETETADNSLTAAVSINERPAGLVLSISNITVSLAKKGPNYQASASVTVRDGSGNIVKEAQVAGTWTYNGNSLNTASSLTREDGTARLDSKKVKANPGDTFTITVTGVSKAGYTYDPAQNTETSDSIVIP